MRSTEFQKARDILKMNISCKKPIHIDFIACEFTARQMQVVRDILKEANYLPSKETLESVVPERREACKKFLCSIPQMEFIPSEVPNQ